MKCVETMKDERVKQNQIIINWHVKMKYSCRKEISEGEEIN